MNKTHLLEQISVELEKVHQGAVKAAKRAYDTATNEESSAENKYDTFGLEASYLAHGQSQRVFECEKDLITFNKIKGSDFLSDSPIAIGALVEIEDEQGNRQSVFISPISGGLKIKYDTNEIILVTPSSPLGVALMSRSVSDEVVVKINNVNKHYLITTVI